jgi:hypothetical protein
LQRVGASEFVPSQLKSDLFDLVLRYYNQYFRRGSGLGCDVEIAGLRADRIHILGRERDIGKSLLGN